MVWQHSNTGYGSKSYEFLLGDGEIPNTFFVQFIGENRNINISGNPKSIVDVCEISGQPEYIFSSSAIINTLSSSDTLDVGQIIFIKGLDGNFTYIEQFAITNGQNKVTLGTSLLRFFSMQCIGPLYTSDINGTLYLYEDTAIASGVPSDVTKIRGVIYGDRNISYNSTLTVPAGYKARAWDLYWDISGTQNGAVKIETLAGSNVLNIPYAKNSTNSLVAAGNTESRVSFTLPFTLDAPIDFLWNVTEANNNNLSVFVNYIVYFEKIL